MGKITITSLSSLLALGFMFESVMATEPGKIKEKALHRKNAQTKLNPDKSEFAGYLRRITDIMVT